MSAGKILRFAVQLLCQFVCASLACVCAPCRFGNHQKPLAILREKATQLLGKRKELVKAGATRFGTHTLVGMRLQKLRNSLQQTVVDPEYVSQNHKDAPDEMEISNAEVHLRQHKGGTAKKLVLDDDEGGFWDRVDGHVRATLPIYKMLRRHVSSAPTVGKVFHGSFEIGANLNKSTTSYKAKMEEKHSARWHYGDVPFFCAAYVLDPEFVDHKKNEDQHIMDGFFDTCERLAILDEVKKDINKYRDNWQARAKLIEADPLKQQTWAGYPKYPTTDSVGVKQFIKDVNAQLSLYRSKKGAFS